MIKIDFEFDTQFGMYRDALILPDNHTFTDEDLSTLKQQRLDNWLTILNTPPIEDTNIPIGGV